MSIPIPNAYGATIIRVERLLHSKSLTWLKVTWETPEGRRYTAKTVPGSTANPDAENHDRNRPARIILNGRSQIILVEEA